MAPFSSLPFTALLAFLNLADRQHQKENVDPTKPTWPVVSRENRRLCSFGAGFVSEDSPKAHRAVSKARATFLRYCFRRRGARRRELDSGLIRE